MTNTLYHIIPVIRHTNIIVLYRQGYILLLCHVLLKYNELNLGQPCITAVMEYIDLCCLVEHTGLVYTITTMMPYYIYLWVALIF